MAAGTSQDSDEMISGINVTPLVDVVLVLLVIFMITAPAIYQAAIKVELPKAVSGEKTDHVTLKFTMLANGTIRLGNEQVSAERTPEIVKQALAQDAKANAVISADRTLSHGAVMSLIDTLKSNGMSQVAIGVESPAQDKGGKK